MTQSPLRDLSPRYDVKGGSPKTPIGGIPQSEFQQYTVQAGNGNGIFKMLAGAAGGLWIMTMLAWWTAFQGRGITRTELRDEMKEYKDANAQRATLVDTQIGELKGRQEKIISDINHIQFQQATDERDFIEFKTDTKNTNKRVGDMLEEQLKAKK